MKETLEHALIKIIALCELTEKKYSRGCEYPEDEMIAAFNALNSAIYKVRNFDYEAYERDAKNAALEAREDEKNER